jgi:ribonuclease R
VDVKGFTIDCQSTRDIDDSIWVECDSRGWTVTVCIANVAAAIAKDSTFDATAKRRVETLYHAGNRNTPMIPRRFSEGTCSLFEGETRSVMAIRIRLDHTLEPQGLARISATKLKSIKRFSYADIPTALKEQKGPLHNEMNAASRLAFMLMERRRRKGAFVLYDLTHGWIMTESGHVRRLKDVRETVGHIIVQELMILANSELARFCIEKNIPVPFRNHIARSSSPPRQRLMDILEHGASTGDPQEFDRVRDSFLMVMEKARYGAALEGHYGLNLPAYLHGTSPIRRFADLVAQRQILGYLNGRNLPYDYAEVKEICEHINDTIDRNAAKRSTVEIGKANERAEKSIIDGRLARIKPKGFERVVKVSVRGKFEQSVAEEFLKRLSKGTATVVDTFQILIKSGDEWSDVRRQILKYLVDNPHIATSIATVAQQSGGWSEPKFSARRGGEDHSVIHIASVDFQKPGLQTGEVKGASLKLAKQRAIVEAFCTFLEEPLPQWPKQEDSVAPSKKNRLPERDSPNPIGELAEYCQIRGLELPVYEAERTGGADHKPEFTVACQAAGLHVKSNPMTSKKAAKKEAAKRAIQLILERS